MGRHKDSVIVVGAGIIGIACAHYLSEAGYRVTLIDRDRAGAACSHGNLGMVCPSHVLPLTEPGAVMEGMKSLFNPNAAFRIKPTLRPSLLLWMLQFARRCNHDQMVRAGHQLLPLLESSMDEYQKLFAGELQGEWKANGLFYVFRSQQGLEKFAATDRLLSETYGLPARRMEGTALTAFEPALNNGLAGGFFYDDDGSVRPDVLIRQWLQVLQAKGVELLQGCALQRVLTTPDAIAGLETSSGTLRADHYVFAAGAWSRLLAKELGCHIPVEPGKGYSLTMSRPELAPRHPMLFPEHRVGATPFDGGYRLGSMMEFAGFDQSIPEKRMRQLRESARPYLQQPTGSEVQETWYGWRPMTWDSLPIIGRVPGRRNAILATGHNMVGITAAPGTGKLVAELLQEQALHLPAEPYSPTRFRGLL